MDTLSRDLHASLPAMRISTSGYGAGGRDTTGQPNLLRLLVGDETAAHSAAEQIAIMETVIDDSSPQLIAYVSEVLLEAGAWDLGRHQQRRRHHHGHHAPRCFLAPLKFQGRNPTIPTDPRLDSGWTTWPIFLLPKHLSTRNHA